MTRRQLDLLLVAVGLPLVALYSRVNVDDPFITFRYAWNFAAGNGLVFNIGEKVLGTTSPLFAIVLGTLSGRADAIPMIAHGISGAALIVAALLLSRIVGSLNTDDAPMIAPLFVLTSPLLAQTQGFELNLYVAFVLGGIRSATLGRTGWSGICLAAAALFRGDALIPAALVGLHVLRAGLGDWRKFAIGFGVPIVLFAAAAWSYYGYPLPNTLAAKRAMGESGLWRGYTYGGLRLAGLYVMHSPLYLALVPVAVLGLRRLLSREEALLRNGRGTGVTFIFIWTGVVFVVYAAMGIPSAFNYYGTLVPVIGILLGLGSGELANRFNSRWVSTAVVVVICAAQIWPSRDTLADVPSPRYEAYRRAAEQIHDLVGPDQTVAVVEIGILSHFSQVRILDLVGLVHPEIGPHLAEGDVSWPVRELRPEFVLLHDPPWPSIETGIFETEWFGKDYTVNKAFSDPAPYRLVLYKRNRIQP
jgi:hypothetical protein